jgi:transmembrane sensor
MDDFERAVAESRDCAHLSFDEERSGAIRAGIERTRMRRRVAGAAALTATAATVVVIGIVGLTRRPAEENPRAGTEPDREMAPRVSVTERVIHLGDGSSVSTSEKAAEVEVVADSETRVEVALRRGRARFEVRPSDERLFRVRAGEVTVDVLGTVFFVDRAARAVGVEVVRGRVRVAHHAAVTILTAGEQRSFPVGGDAEADADWPSPVDKSAPRKRPGRDHVGSATAPAPAVAQRDAGAGLAVEPTSSASWQELARNGEYRRAYALVQEAGMGAFGHDVGDLLLWADVTRLVGHPDEAIAPLRRVLAEHAGDRRAPLAAFSLGRTLLRDLDEPLAAADAFRRAIELAPDGALAEDALAHEVEAWSRAGDTRQARERARRYMNRYPEGRWRVRVLRLGGER